MNLKFWQRQTTTQPPAETPQLSKIKVAIVSFDDDCPQNCGKILQNLLSSCPFLDVYFHEDTTSKNFLDFQQGCFFDLIETGHAIFKKTGADILVWGKRQGEQIRLIFHKKQHYEKPEIPFFSVLNNLVFPLSFFQTEEFSESALILIISALATAAGDQQNLNPIMERLSRSVAPKGLTEKEIPYVFLMLASVFVKSKAQHLTLSDAEIILKLLRQSYDFGKKAHDNLIMGCFYTQAGQLFALLSQKENRRHFTNLRKAIESLRYARKFFNRYNYPYDFGLQSYWLSKQYFEFWRQTNDIQALRDAVFYLRECEKIFTTISFPQLWGSIEKDLGYYLSLLGSYGKNDEILMTAVDCYKKSQKSFERNTQPQIWAQVEESVGSILYTIGKMHDQEEYLNEAIRSFAAAADVYENLSMISSLRQMRVCQSKAEEQIMRIQSK